MLITLKGLKKICGFKNIRIRVDRIFLKWKLPNAKWQTTTFCLRVSEYLDWSDCQSTFVWYLVDAGYFGKSSTSLSLKTNELAFASLFLFDITAWEFLKMWEMMAESVKTRKDTTNVPISSLESSGFLVSGTTVCLTATTTTITF